MTDGRDGFEAADARLLLHARLDGELDAASALALERRFAADPELSAEAERLSALGRAIASLPRGRAPDGLRDAVARLAAPPPWRDAGWRRTAAAALAALCLGAGGTWIALDRGPAGDPFEAVIAGHARALAASQPTDVASSDRHVVKPWFNGRVPFAPRVFDLADQGFPLIGGRVDVVGGAMAATLVYRRRNHLISVTASVGEAGPWSGSERGFSLARWGEDGVAYRAVSDLNARELRAFEDLFKARARDP